MTGLLVDGPIGSSGGLAVGWCPLIALGGYPWSQRLHRRQAAG